jgi:hypothetical protein
MAREINRPTHLDIDEISLVDHPASSETDASCQNSGSFCRGDMEGRYTGETYYGTQRHFEVSKS